MLKFYRKYKDEMVETEVTKDEALTTLLSTFRDNDMTRDMLTIQNYIQCRFAFIRVDDPDNPMKPIPGFWNRLPEDKSYDRDGNRLN